MDLCIPFNSTLCKIGHSCPMKWTLIKSKFFHVFVFKTLWEVNELDINIALYVIFIVVYNVNRFMRSKPVVYQSITWAHDATFSKTKWSSFSGKLTNDSLWTVWRWIEERCSLFLTVASMLIVDATLCSLFLHLWGYFWR